MYNRNKLDNRTALNCDAMELQYVPSGIVVERQTGKFRHAQVVPDTILVVSRIPKIHKVTNDGRKAQTYVAPLASSMDAFHGLS